MFCWKKPCQANIVPVPFLCRKFDILNLIFSNWKMCSRAIFYVNISINCVGKRSQQTKACKQESQWPCRRIESICKNLKSYKREDDVPTVRSLSRRRWIKKTRCSKTGFKSTSIAGQNFQLHSCSCPRFITKRRRKASIKMPACSGTDEPRFYSKYS